MTPAGAPWASARTRLSESLRLQSDKRAPLPERFHHPHQTGKLTPKCRPRDFLSGARRNLPRNCLCRLERIRGRDGCAGRLQRTCLCSPNSLISGKIQGISANVGEWRRLEASIHKGLAAKFPKGRTGNSSTRTANFLYNNRDHTRLSISTPKCPHLLEKRTFRTRMLMSLSDPQRTCVFRSQADMR
jgi:hypothetical protein